MKKASMVAVGLSLGCVLGAVTITGPADAATTVHQVTCTSDGTQIQISDTKGIECFVGHGFYTFPNTPQDVTEWATGNYTAQLYHYDATWTPMEGPHQYLTGMKWFNVLRINVK